MLSVDESCVASSEHEYKIEHSTSTKQIQLLLIKNCILFDRNSSSLNVDGDNKPLLEELNNENVTRKNEFIYCYLKLSFKHCLHNRLQIEPFQVIHPFQLIRM